MRKYLIALLVLSLVFTGFFPNFTSANNGVNITVNEDGITQFNSKEHNVSIKIIEDNEKERIVESWDNKIKSTIVFNKETNDVSITTTDLEGNLISQNTIQEMLKKSASDTDDSYSLASLIDSNSDSTGDYRYYYYTNNIWVITIPGQSKNTFETSRNSSDLLNFRDSIDNLVYNQNMTAAAFAGSTAATIAALIVTPEPWTTIVGILTAMGAGAAVIAYAYSAWDSARDARFYYNRVTIDN